MAQYLREITLENKISFILLNDMKDSRLQSWILQHCVNLIFLSYLMDYKIC
jgi:hypothetical protein